MKVLRVPLAIRLVLVVVPIAVVAYWAMTYRGLYRVFAELELRVIGEYVPTLTVLLSAVVMIGGSVAVLRVLAQFWPGGADDEKAAAEAGRRGKRVDAWVRAHPVQLLGFILAPVCLVVAVYFLVDAATTGSLSRTSAQALESGVEPASRFVDLEGRLERSLAVGVTTSDRGRNSTTLYIPVVSTAWRRGQPIAVFLEIDEDMYERAPLLLEYRGVLAKNDLPGVAQTQLDGVAMTSPYYVLGYNATRELSLVMAATLGSIGLVVGIALLIVRRRRR